MLNMSASRMSATVTVVPKIKKHYTSRSCVRLVSVTTQPPLNNRHSLFSNFNVCAYRKYTETQRAVNWDNLSSATVEALSSTIVRTSGEATGDHTPCLDNSLTGHPPPHIHPSLKRNRESESRQQVLVIKLVSLSRISIQSMNLTNTVCLTDFTSAS